MSSLTDVSKKWEGRVVDGKFPLRQWLGGSEHSAVFLTERSATGSQKAAIKLIPSDFFSDGNLDETGQLARWSDSAKLSHPYLIQLFEHGRGKIDDRNFLYVVMEYAEENLAQILPQRPLSPDEVKEMLPPTAETLAFLHQAGLVHGHLKPANILAVDDQLKISADSLRKIGERDKQFPDTYHCAGSSEDRPIPGGRCLVTGRDAGCQPDPARARYQKYCQRQSGCDTRINSSTVQQNCGAQPAHRSSATVHCQRDSQPA